MLIIRKSPRKQALKLCFVGQPNKVSAFDFETSGVTTGRFSSFSQNLQYFQRPRRKKVFVAGPQQHLETDFESYEVKADKFIRQIVSVNLKAMAALARTPARKSKKMKRSKIKMRT